MSNDSRYDEILRRIQQRKAEEANKPKQDALAAVLDGVNALGVLEAVKKRPPAGLTVFGPRAFRKAIHIDLSAAAKQTAASPDDGPWLGTVIWHKPKGYGHYDVLGLLGIWAVQNGEAIHLIVGTRQLAFSAPVFNPESYHNHLRRGFSLYYAGEPSPPEDDTGDSILLRASYDITERLALREAVEAAVKAWRGASGV
jgi:hypothetical protein